MKPKANFLVSDITRRQIEDLSVAWAGIRNAHKSHVLAEAVRRAWESEPKAWREQHARCDGSCPICKGKAPEKKRGKKNP